MMADKVALVTGATRGIGRAIADQLASEGYVVYYNYRSTIDVVTGDYVKTIKGDIASLEDCSRMIDEIVAAQGKIDVLVNNAGITRDGLLMRMKEEDFDMVINTNLKGVYNMCKAAVKPMMKKRFGKIVNISSVVGITGNAGQCNYAASKAGVIGFSKSLAKEVATRNITVNCVAPGFIQSDMTDELSDEQKQNIMKNIPMQRFGTVEDVAKTVSFLASDNASYITGQVISVDGGMV
ncbi:MAG: 3-oxoacyl-[acyl-carrier-protein] reductase [Erysipelotrichaceae bacterium]|nr:3-oxoacyl-[acyl-carrier-protein] reductase [Erysipelotrichaceae bacterium]MDD3809447.1 3-oxoacyl-[acyl-carrier-protein] reductase [Erysipelotrichaceae bacterium]